MRGLLRNESQKEKQTKAFIQTGYNFKKILLLSKSKSTANNKPINKIILCLECKKADKTSTNNKKDNQRNEISRCKAKKIQKGYKIDKKKQIIFKGLLSLLIDNFFN